MRKAVPTLPFSAQGTNDGCEVMHQLHAVPHLGFVCVYVVYFTPWFLQISLTWHCLLSDQIHSGIIVRVFVPVIHSPFSSV